MSQRIRVTVDEVVLSAELNDSATAQAILDALPIEGNASRWGDEFYFGIPVKQQAGPDARDVMEVGELAYWPPGNAFCIFFGPTPVSHDNEPRAANPANPVGRILDSIEPLKSLPSTVRVVIETESMFDQRP
jgi:hypothetical protein